MALNIATLKTRALTALIFVAVMLIGLLWNFWAFVILFTVIHFGCWLEYLKIVEKIYNTTIDVAIKWVFTFCGFVFMLVFGLNHIWFDAGKEILGTTISFKVILWMVLFICLIVFAVQNKNIATKVKWLMFAGFAYITLSFTLFLNLRDNIYIENADFKMLDFGKVYVCGVMFSIWINDTMAYLVGSVIGKTPFSKISPKKTWEGTIGGAILCIVVITLLGYYIPAGKAIAWQHWVAIAAICAIFGTLGDLFESKLKRMANVKDSGSIMPGHGGFLDRFDSLLFAAPAVWLYVKIFI